MFQITLDEPFVPTNTSSNRNYTIAYVTVIDTERLEPAGHCVHYDFFTKSWPFQVPIGVEESFLISIRVGEELVDGNEVKTTFYSEVVLPVKYFKQEADKFINEHDSNSFHRYCRMVPGFYGGNVKNLYTNVDKALELFQVSLMSSAPESNETPFISFTFLNNNIPSVAFTEKESNGNSLLKPSFQTEVSSHASSKRSQQMTASPARVNACNSATSFLSGRQQRPVTNPVVSAGYLQSTKSSLQKTKQCPTQSVGRSVSPGAGSVSTRCGVSTSSRRQTELAQQLKTLEQRQQQLMDWEAKSMKDLEDQRLKAEMELSNERQQLMMLKEKLLNEKEKSVEVLLTQAQAMANEARLFKYARDEEKAHSNGVSVESVLSMQSQIERLSDGLNLLVRTIDNNQQSPVENDLVKSNIEQQERLNGSIDSLRQVAESTKSLVSTMLTTDEFRKWDVTMAQRQSAMMNELQSLREEMKTVVQSAFHSSSVNQAQTTKTWSTQVENAVVARLVNFFDTKLSQVVLSATAAATAAATTSFNKQEFVDEKTSLCVMSSPLKSEQSSRRSHSGTVVEPKISNVDESLLENVKSATVHRTLSSVASQRASHATSRAKSIQSSSSHRVTGTFVKSYSMASSQKDSEVKNLTCRRVSPTSSRRATTQTSAASSMAVSQVSQIPSSMNKTNSSSMPTLAAGKRKSSTVETTSNTVENTHAVCASSPVHKPIDSPVAVSHHRPLTAHPIPLNHQRLLQVANPSSPVPLLNSARCVPINHKPVSQGVAFRQGGPMPMTTSPLHQASYASPMMMMMQPGVRPIPQQHHQALPLSAPPPMPFPYGLPLPTDSSMKPPMPIANMNNMNNMHNMGNMANMPMPMSMPMPMGSRLSRVGLVPMPSMPNFMVKHQMMGPSPTPVAVMPPQAAKLMPPGMPVKFAAQKQSESSFHSSVEPISGGNTPRIPHHQNRIFNH